MVDEDLGLSGLSSSATGILECLRMLADEAAELQLDDTLQALQRAIAVCQTERGKTEPADGVYRAPANAIIH